jgi:hypothetical protein
VVAKTADTAVAKADKPVLAGAKAGKPAAKPVTAAASAKPVAVATKADVAAPAPKADKPVLADAKAGRPAATVSKPSIAAANSKPANGGVKPEKATVAVAKTDKPANAAAKPEKTAIADAKDKPVAAKPALAANADKTGKTPVKTADADKTKNGVPALRMASGGY